VRRLTVREPGGTIVAEVEIDPSCAAEPELLHVFGRFSPGPGFARVKLLLDEFEALYGKGDLAGAAEAHERIDRLQLTATSTAGVEYAVFNVYFPDAGLLFTVSKTSVSHGTTEPSQ
jgi:hypothetical protein